MVIIAVAPELSYHSVGVLNPLIQEVSLSESNSK